MPGPISETYRGPKLAGPSADELERLDTRIAELEAERDRALADCAALRGALSLAEAVYRKNVVAVGEPSSVLEAMQKALSDHPGDKLLAVIEAAKVFKAGCAESDFSCDWEDGMAGLFEALDALGEGTG